MFFQNANRSNRLLFSCKLTPAAALTETFLILAKGNWECIWTWTPHPAERLYVFWLTQSIVKRQVELARLAGVVPAVGISLQLRRDTCSWLSWWIRLRSHSGPEWPQTDFSSPLLWPRSNCFMAVWTEQNHSDLSTSDFGHCHVWLWVRFLWNTTSVWTDKWPVSDLDLWIAISHNCLQGIPNKNTC